MSLKAILLALLVVAIWGIGFTIGKVAITSIPPFFLLAIRFSLVSLLLLPFTRFPRAHLRPLLELSVVQITLQFAFLFIALKHVNASVVSVVILCEVPISIVLASFYFSERLRLGKWLAIVVTLIAAAFMTLQPNVAIEPRYCWAVLAAALMFAIANIQMKKLHQLKAESIVAYTALLAVPQLFLLSFLFEHHQYYALMHAHAAEYWSLAYLVFLQTLTATFIWIYLLHRYDVKQVMPFNLLTPVFGVVSGILILHESMSGLAALNAALIILCVAYIQYEPRTRFNAFFRFINRNKQRTVLMIETSSSGLALLPLAQSMGYRTLVLSANTDERRLSSAALAYVDILVCVDTNDEQAVLSKGEDLAVRYSICAVIPGFELYVAVAAKLAARLHVPGNPITTCDALRDKALCKTLLQQAGVRVTRFHQISSHADLFLAEQAVRFPAVLKPVAQSGSVHVTRVDSSAELLEAYEAMCQDTWTEMAQGVGSLAILEEYICKPEYSVEGYFSEGQFRVVSITEKGLGPEPHFVELSHIVDADLSSTTSKTIEAYVRSVCQALGLCVGVVHAEVRMDKAGPVLIEIAGRLAGDSIPRLVRLARGFDLYKAMLNSHLGLLVRPNISTGVAYAGVQFYVLGKAGSYRAMQGVDALKGLPGFQSFTTLIPANEPIAELTSFQQRVAYAIFTAKTHSELKKTLAQSVSLLVFDS